MINVSNLGTLFLCLVCYLCANLFCLLQMLKRERLVPSVKPFEGCVCLVSQSVWYVRDSMLSPQQCLAKWDFRS